MQPASPPDPDLLNRIPLYARTILDIGCGDGTLAAAYRQMNPKARLLGIDADPIAAELARQHLDEVATLDIEAAEPPFDLAGGIDCIIYDQVLERLRDPWGLVRRHVDLLTPNGMMLIRLANPEHWRIAEHLLRGVWDDESPPSAPAAPYLFNLDRARAALLDAGLTLCDVTLCDDEADTEAARHFVNAITPGLIALGADPEGYAQRSTPTYFIWRVRKLPAQRMIVSGNMLDPVGGVSHVRVVHPLSALQTDPLLSVAVTHRLETEKPSDDIPRIFVLHRPALTTQGGGADQHPRARRSPAQIQSRGRGLPQRHVGAAAGTQFPRSAGTNSFLRRTEPRGLLAPADAGDKPSRRRGRQPPAIPGRARSAVLRGAGNRT